jgi:hypothetical protein
MLIGCAVYGLMLRTHYGDCWVGRAVRAEQLNDPNLQIDVVNQLFNSRWTSFERYIKAPSRT